MDVKEISCLGDKDRIEDGDNDGEVVVEPHLRERRGGDERAPNEDVEFGRVLAVGEGCTDDQAGADEQAKYLPTRAKEASDLVDNR